jgi:membrane protease YdiL (CAAX protease family)
LAPAARMTEQPNEKMLFRNGIKWRPVVAIVLSTCLLVTDRYFTIFNPKVIDRTILYLLIPLLTVIVLFRQKPEEYGFSFGNFRLGLKVALITGILGVGQMYLISRIGAFREYYAPYALFGLPIPLLTFLDLFGWEFLFRGFLLFALVEICGPYAILLQAVPFTIAHIGKPAIETYSCIIGGTLFGLVAYRTKSFIYPFLIHWMIASSIIYFSLGK